ncbi:diguanylate cyclase domain-containing protein [Methylotenera versatilis]|uniref:Diguanylate cyclase n=1 Tax=Methylotenera versatilis (strain 301) TaxID=666681 RepID=D7DM32_METV0|nr:diguanylate cyclase [Methylotenera versatilis]ADI30726.1 diguanylate cyclase [Methylotenera versatilis 301]
MLNYKKEIIYPLLAASLLISVVMLSLFYTMYNLNKIEKNKDFIDTQRFNIITLRNAVLDAETSQRGYLITNNVTFLDHYNEGKIQAYKTLDKLSKSSEKLPSLAPILEKIQRLCDDKFSIIEASTSVQLNAGSYASHLSLSKDRGKAVMDNIRTALMEADKDLLERRHTLSNRMQTTIRYSIIAGVSLAVMIFGILIFSYLHTLHLFKVILSSSNKVDHLSHQATHDPLTNLLNRRGFENRLQNIHDNAIIEKQKYAIFYMDLDNFKTVNDQYSHAIGDQLLITVSQLFQNCLREHDALARLGGDEFTLIVQKFKDKDELETLANRLINALKNPIPVENAMLSVGVSIGVAVHRSDAFTPKKLMMAADKAMYHAKNSGKNKVVFLNKAASQN